jgi:hypothetical protein
MPYFISHFYKSPAQSLALSAHELSIASAASSKGLVSVFLCATVQARNFSERACNVHRPPWGIVY